MNIIIPENKSNHFIVFDFRPTDEISKKEYSEDLADSYNYIYVVKKENLGKNLKFYGNLDLANIFSAQNFDIKSIDFVDEIILEKTPVSKIIKKETENPVNVRILPSLGCLFIDCENPCLNTLTVKYSETEEYDYTENKPYFSIKTEDYLPSKNKTNFVK